MVQTRTACYSQTKHNNFVFVTQCCVFRYFRCFTKIKKNVRTLKVFFLFDGIHHDVLR